MGHNQSKKIVKKSRRLRRVYICGRLRCLCLCSFFILKMKIRWKKYETIDPVGVDGYGIFSNSGFVVWRAAPTHIGPFARLWGFCYRPTLPWATTSFFTQKTLCTACRRHFTPPKFGQWISRAAAAYGHMLFRRCTSILTIWWPFQKCRRCLPYPYHN